MEEAANAGGDAEMVIKLGSNDLVASEAKYHDRCRVRYTSKGNLKYTVFKEDKGYEDVYADAFPELTSSVEVALREEEHMRWQAFQLSTSLFWGTTVSRRQRAIQVSD